MSNIFYDYHHRENKISQKESEFSRILTAAIVNEKFRRLLLSNPGLAIKNGFSGESFNFKDDERMRIAAIRASSLAEFARQMNAIASRLAAVTLD